jgi:hypothetical protein
MKWVEHVECMKMFSRKSEEKRPLGLRERGCKDDIEMDVKAIGYEGMAWTASN